MGEPARAQSDRKSGLYLPRSPLLSGGGGAGGGGGGAAHMSVAKITEPSGQVCVAGGATGAGADTGAAAGTRAGLLELKL